jgi:hypothetical protein
MVQRPPEMVRLSVRVISHWLMWLLFFERVGRVLFSSVSSDVDDFRPSGFVLLAKVDWVRLRGNVIATGVVRVESSILGLFSLSIEDTRL